MLASLSIFSLAVLAVATPDPKPQEAPTLTITVTAQPTTTEPGRACPTGDLQCCVSTEEATYPAVAQILDLLRIAVQPGDALVGMTCSPIGIGNSCNGAALCCQSNVDGLIPVGCEPVSFN